MNQNIEILLFTILLAVGIAYLILYFFAEDTVKKTEGFANPIPTVTMCPGESKSYYDNKGNLNCCEGSINGTSCEGNLICTFSGALNNIPKCNEIKRRRKYIGPINPFIRQFLQSSPRQQYSLLLTGFKQVQANLNGLSEKQFATEDKTKLKALVDEQEAFYANESNEKTKLDVYEDEVMYTIQSLQTLFANKPILQDKSLLQKQAQKLVCTLQN